ncbi:MazG nucleotide pyrophosphohydrolase domain-containing protein [Nocardioides sp. MAHUQ-72]|uniref:MazG nucleotide pyrophosphohydrolase domain-containing protein n=1 Tax=unclassified Nocardioides TaxID=2615069 RepID=UPI003617AC5B
MAAPTAGEPDPRKPASEEPLLEFREVMRRLRAECGWKREQTHRSLARYLVEELHETLEALDTWEATGDGDHLCEELGDLLLQVYFHAVVAEEAGSFSLDDVARGITEKMYRRNPHVFAPEGAPRAPAGDAAAVNDAWQAIKAQEKERESVTDGLPASLPALLWADKVLDRLGREGPGSSPDPDSPAAQIVARPPSDDLGDRLLALVAEANLAGIDPEQALRDAVRRLI